MRKEFYLTVFLVIISFWVFGLQPQPGDSAGIEPQKKKNTPIITTRVHTMGLFLYMGKVVNHNPAADIFFNYTTRSGLGISAFKVVDINDPHSNNNFAFAFLHKSFHLGEKISVSPYLGVALEQQHSFASHGSDAMAQLLTTFHVSKTLTVEHIAIFNNVAVETDHADWTNRFRVVYSKGHLDVIGLFWHNNGLIDQESYVSTGASVYYNRIPVANKLWLGAGLTSLFTVQSADREVPTQCGLQFTTALTFK